MTIEVNRICEEKGRELVSSIDFDCKWLESLVSYAVGDDMKLTCLTLHSRLVDLKTVSPLRPMASELSNYSKLVEFLEDQKINHFCVIS